MKKEQSKAKVKVNISKPLVMEGILTKKEFTRLWAMYKIHWKEQGFNRIQPKFEDFMDWLSERKDER